MLIILSDLIISILYMGLSVIGIIILLIFLAVIVSFGIVLIHYVTGRLNIISDKIKNIWIINKEAVIRRLYRKKM